MWLLAVLACSLVGDLLSGNDIIDASCAGTDTVVVDGRDLCAEFEATGHVNCDVGYTIRLDGVQVCP
jgi:hypothetical protein